MLPNKLPQVTETEDVLQAKCFQWHWNKYPAQRRTLWHIPNGGQRNAREGAKFKAMGVVAGVADLHWLYKGRLFVFELKVGSNTLSEAQKQWRAAVVPAGALWFEIRSLEQFQEVIKQAVKIE